jgi:hypothetical protein
MGVLRVGGGYLFGEDAVGIDSFLGEGLEVKGVLVLAEEERLLEVEEFEDGDFGVALPD